MPPKQNQPPRQRPPPPPKLAPLPTPTPIITPKIMLSDQPNNLFKPLTSDQTKSISSKNNGSTNDIPLIFKYPQLIIIIPASLLILLVMKK